MAEGFLELLLGIHDVRSNGGSKLPRRNVLNFLNGRVFDANGETQIIVVDNPLWTETDVLAAQADDYAPTGYENATDIAVAGGQVITGFQATGANVKKQRVWNLDAALGTTINHEDASSAASNRVLTSTSLPVVVAPGTAATIVRNLANTRWLLLPCTA